MSHTPGPWCIDPRVYRGIDGGRHAYVEVSSRSKIIWIAKVQTFTDNSGEMAANARLIAAAPDLLAVAKAAEECLRHAECCKDDPDWQRSCVNISQNARAAIAKVEQDAGGARG